MQRFDSLTTSLMADGTLAAEPHAAPADPEHALGWAPGPAFAPEGAYQCEARPSQRRARLARVASSFLAGCDDAHRGGEGEEEGEEDCSQEPLSQMSLTEDFYNDMCGGARGNGADTPPPCADDDDETSSAGPGSPPPLLPGRDREADIFVEEEEQGDDEGRDGCPASQEPFALQDDVIATQDYDKCDDSQEPAGAALGAHHAEPAFNLEHQTPPHTCSGATPAEDEGCATPACKRRAVVVGGGDLLGFTGKRTACPAAECPTTPDGLRRSTRARTMVPTTYQESDEDEGGKDGGSTARKRPRSDEEDTEMLMRSQGARDSRNWWFDERTRLQGLCREAEIDGSAELRGALDAFRLGAQNETLLRYVHVCIARGVIIQPVFTRSKCSAFGLTSFRVAPERNYDFFEGLAGLFRLDPSEWMAASGRARKTLLTGLTRFGIKPAYGNSNKWLSAYQGAVPFVAVKARKVVLPSQPVRSVPVE